MSPRRGKKESVLKCCWSTKTGVEVRDAVRRFRCFAEYRGGFIGKSTGTNNGNQGRGDNEGLFSRRVTVSTELGKVGVVLLVGGSGLVVEDSQGSPVVLGLTGGLAIPLQNKGDPHPITFRRWTILGGSPRNSLASGHHAVSTRLISQSIGPYHKIDATNAPFCG